MSRLNPTSDHANFLRSVEFGTLRTGTARANSSHGLMRLLLAVCALALAAAAAAPCDERKMERDAVVLLAAHMDGELGGVGAGKRDVVGFQYLV